MGPCRDDVHIVSTVVRLRKHVSLHFAILFEKLYLHLHIINFCLFIICIYEKKHPVIPLSQAVETIKTAILQGQYEALKEVNRVQLAVYYAIGKYLSKNTRKGVWGTSALKQISDQLRKELPGLRGYSEANLKNMRLFYEQWIQLDSNSSVATDELLKAENQTDTSYTYKSSVTTVDLYSRDNQINILPDVEELRKIMRKGIDG
ncbi:MAG: hypothetical protein IKX43_00405 [Paludibacteraceae bacterium]|nr:hypothetical protein [Paludibacteraceae bacterium]